MRQGSYVGQQIGNYRLIAEINSGGYGSVYQGKHVVFDDEPLVALKLLHTHLGSVREQEQFIQEARLLRKLKHPYILPILDAGLSQNVPYLVTEYATRGSLQERLHLATGHPLPLEEALTILSQIGQALYYAHQQNIVHRDLKPGNILFNGQGNALLADFGIAVAMETAGTKELGKSGTPAYMSPEQFEGMVSMKSDQYALGCIAYELLTGRRPFTVTHPTLEAMWYQHNKVAPVPPTQRNPAISSHVEQAILKALAKQRTDRHADVAAFLAALLPPPPETKITTSEIVEPAVTVDLQRASSYQDESPQIIDLARDVHRVAEKNVVTPESSEPARVVNPEKARDYRTRAQTLIDLEEYPQALVALDKAIHNDPTNAEAYGQKGFVLERTGSYRGALRAFQQVLMLEPRNAWATWQKAIALNGLKRYPEALAAAEQAIRLDPVSAYAYREKGDALEHLERYAEALEAYKQVLRLDPTDDWTARHQAFVLNRLQRYAEALTCAEHAIRLDPANALAYREKGDALAGLARYPQALQAYERALKLDPTDAWVAEHKALVLKKLR